MNINIDEMGKKLHAKLDSGIDQLKAAKSHLEDFTKETEDAIQSKLDAAKEAVEEKKQEAATAKTKLEEYVEAKKDETTAAVDGWKANRDLKKLEKRAERAEKNADVCVELALYYAGEAQVAILEATGARIDADNAG
jgi:vacuolar-type H+-ATPase subunit I/STV1